MSQKKFEANYDEAKVPEYELPEIVGEVDGSFEAIWAKRRSELLQAFGEQMYGFQPKLPFKTSFEKLEEGSSCDGKALRQQYRITIKTEAGSHSIDLLIFTPANAKQAVPTFLGLSFFGNHTVSDDPEITITDAWCRSSKDKGVVDSKATEKGRGTSKSRWPIEMIVDAGYGVATCYCGDIDPDFHDEFQNGVHALFPKFVPGTDHPDRWGTISAWAWGLSRMLDCLDEVV
ncbi:MAG: acetylxylan esterase, partial [Planctomycetota bacterium]